MSGLVTVYIEREPLLTMVFAAVEMFNRECLGYLFGYESGKPTDCFVITNAVQSAAVVHRSMCEVTQSKRANRRLNALMGKAPKLFPYLADFHSHLYPKGRPWLFDPSPGDRGNMNEEDRFCIIIAIGRRGKRLLEWGFRDEGTRLRGTLDRFDIHFTAHRIVRDDEGNPVKDDENIQKAQRLPLQVANATLRALNKAAGIRS